MKKAILLALALPLFASDVYPPGNVNPKVPEVQDLACREKRQHILDIESAIQYYEENESPAVREKMDLQNEKFVKEIQNALYFHGYLYSFYEGVLDQGTMGAVAFYKRKNALHGSGIDSQFVKHISTPSKARVELLEEILGLSQKFDFSNSIYINIPEFRMRYYFDNQQQVEMAVIVGDGKVKLSGDGRWQTLVQNGTIETAVINPYWNVPGGDLTVETRADLRKSSGLRKTMEQFLGRKWVPVGSDVLGSRFRQLPGPKNSLGRVEYNFNGGYGELLHGTPKKRLFKDNVRNFSHGCIRLEDEIALLRRFQELSVVDQGIDLQDMLVVMEKGRYKTQKVLLTLPVAVNVVYMRAWVDEYDGRLVMVMPPDIYDCRKSRAP